MTTTTVPESSGAANFLGVLWKRIKNIPPVYPVFLVIFLGVSLIKPYLSHLTRHFHLPAPGSAACNFDDW